MTKVYVGVGHGITNKGLFDPGAVGRDGTQEYGLAFQVVSAMHHALARSGVEHYAETASGAGHDLDYVGSTAAINAGGYDLAVEVHFDSGDAPRGGFGIYANEQSRGKQYAAACASRWARENLPQRPNYADRRGLWLLQHTDPPALIWECDTTMPHDAETLYRMGEALAAGTCDFLGVPYAQPGETHPQPAPLPAPPTPGGGLPAIQNVVGFVALDHDPNGAMWVAAADGGVFCLNGAPYFGSMGGHPLNAPIVDIVGYGTIGYWLIGADGGIFSFGAAPLHTPWAGLFREYQLKQRSITSAAEVADSLVLLSNRGERYVR